LIDLLKKSEQLDIYLRRIKKERERKRRKKRESNVSTVLAY